MATQKRRVIYASDADWATWQREAAATGRSVSDFIRSHLAGYSYAERVSKVEREAFTEGVVKTAEKVARTIPAPPGTYAAFNTRPLRPAPKPSQKGK